MTSINAAWEICFFLSLAAAGIMAQQPFVTDDADVTDKGVFHTELGNEFDRLQPSSLPVRYQDGARATISYGLIKGVEVGVAGQFLVLESEARPRTIGGIGDTNF